MKNLIYFILTVCVLLNSNCSKIDGALDNAESIDESTKTLTDDAREGTAIQIMDRELEKLKNEPNIKTKISYAKTILALLPFQYIKRHRSTHISNSLGWFYTKIFYSCIKDHVKNNGDELDQMTELIWNSEMIDLNAFALSLDYIKDSQKEISKNPRSILDLTFEIVKANQCKDCKLNDMKFYVNENLKFSDEAIVMLQFAHNALSMAGFKGVLREPTFQIKDWGKLWNGLTGQLTLQDILRPGTNQKDISDATDRLMQATEIRNFLIENNIEPLISDEFYDKVKTIQGIKNRKINFDNLGSNEIIIEYFESFESTLEEINPKPIKVSNPELNNYIAP